jgi:hypothetical protein
MVRHDCHCGLGYVEVEVRWLTADYNTIHRPVARGGGSVEPNPFDINYLIFMQYFIFHHFNPQTVSF